MGVDHVPPSKVSVVDPVDSGSFQAKAADLYALSDAVQNGLLHVRASGADFLGALRKSFSNTFFRRLVTCGAEEFQNRTGNPPPQAITEPPNLDNEASWRMRRDMEGCAPNKPAALLIPPMECRSEELRDGKGGDSTCRS